MNGYTGRLFEEEVLGRCGGSWDGTSYLSYRESMRFVVEHQKWNPTDPEPQRANDVHALVAMAMDIEDWSELGFFTAVGSQLDRFHGIDAFFVFEGRVVTIDVTLNPHKDEHKADFIVYEQDLESHQALNELAKRVADVLECERR